MIVSFSNKKLLPGFILFDYHFSVSDILGFFVFAVLFLTVASPGSGQSFDDAKDKFKRAFSSGNFSQQRKSLKALGQYDKKEAYDLIKGRMLRLAQRLWKIEDAFMNLDRRSKKKNRWSELQKRAFQLHDSGRLKKIRKVFQTGAGQLRQPAKPEWIMSLVQKLGKKNVSITSLYTLMKGKLLTPLADMTNRHAPRLLLDVLRQAEIRRPSLKRKKQKYNQKISKYSHEKNVKKGNLRKPHLQRKRITRRISILDVLRRRIYNHLSKLSGEKAITVLIENGLKSSNFEVRAAAAHGLSFREDSRSRNALVQLLKNEKKYQVQIELLKAIGKRAIQSAETVVQSFLKGSRTPVQYAAAHVLGRIGTMDSTSALINRMEEVKSGRLYEEIVDSLSYMTGKTFGADTEDWREWYEKHKNDSLDPPSERRLPDEARSGQGDQKSSTEFYGVPLTSNNMMFVIDASKSMRNDAEFTGASAGFDPGGPGPRVPRLPRKPSRMDVAKNQLMKAIKGLDRNRMFNFIFFAGFNTIWNKNQMVPATPNMKLRAFKFIRDVKMQWATVIYDALELGFRFGTVGNVPVGERRSLNTRMTKLAPDTMILMSDGQPIYGQYDMRKKTGSMYNTMFQKINKLNQFRLLKISGISIGNKKFFQKLINRTMYYPDPKKRPDWWIQPGVAVGR